MNFGIETYEGLTEEDFKLSQNLPAVLSGVPVENPETRIGLPKWGSKAWVGLIYPGKAKEKEFLSFYCQAFNSIELNATHYKIPTPGEIKRWTDSAGDIDFKFCPKIHQEITHVGSLNGKQFHINQFMEAISNFKHYLGPIFLQVPETFSPRRKAELYGFLKQLPAGYTFFLEIRHPEWFSTPGLLDELCGVLKEQNMGLVITDTPNRRDVMHLKLTIPQVFVRFVCFGDHELDRYRIEQWGGLLKHWNKKGLQSTWFFLHTHNEKSAIEFSRFVKQQFTL